MRNALDITRLQSVYKRVARYYDFQHGLLTAYSDQRGRRLLVENAVWPGANVLDCGAGTGSTGILAANKSGVEGSVVFFDMSEAMLAVARDKATQAQILTRSVFQIGDLHDLPFEDKHFDVVLSGYSLCPVRDPEQGTRELYRVTRPGGRIGIAHSTHPEKLLPRWLAEQVERIVWRLPALSLGCRSVEVLPTLERLGCKVLLNRYMGFPLWPLRILVVEKT